MEVDFADYISVNPLLKSSIDTTEYTIKQFLARPIICSNPSWTTVMGQGTNLMNMLPSAMLNSNATWSDKIQGFYGFKGTFCFKVQFNCQRFQSGIALISALPAAGHISSTRRSLVESSIIYKSQLPSVRLNINECDEAEIRIPFTSPELFYNRVSTNDWVKVYVDVYSQLKGGDIVGTCWCWFEDVELFIPTAQSGRVSSTSKRNVNYTDKEDEGGILSQPLSLFSRGFSSLSKNIPSLSSVAQPTAWFLDACSKGFAAFGFSSAIDTEVRKAVILKSLPHHNNCDVNDTSDSFGMTASNKVAHLSGFAATDVDEMSISYICQIPSYVATTNWINTAVAGTKLFEYNVHPMFHSGFTSITPSTGPAVDIYRFPPMGYMASNFSNWRGSIVYRFFASKTDFHTGRILFTYTPNANDSITDIFSNASYVYKWIWDIKDSHSFEITLPYLNSASYGSTSILTGGRNTSTGNFSAWVLNPLNAPATVSSSVDLITEVKGGPDFELAVVLPSDSFTPILAYSGDINPNRKFSHRERVYSDKEPQKYEKSKMQKKKITQTKRDLKYQIYAEGPLDVGQTSNSLHLDNEYKPIMVAKQPMDDNIASLYTTGETIKSLRQLMKRTSWFLYLPVGTASTKVETTFNPQTPYLSVVLQGGVNNLLPSSNLVDFYSRFASLFALQRGGIIIRAVTSSTQGILFGSMLNTVNNRLGLTTTFNVTNVADQNDAESRVLTLTQSQGALDVLVPYYARTASIPVVHLSSPTASTVDGRLYADQKTIKIASWNNSSQNRFELIGRKVADDFSLGAFIGVLPLHFKNVPFPT